MIAAPLATQNRSACTVYEAGCNDHPDLMSRGHRHVLLKKDAKLVHEKTEPVQSIPRRLRFGKRALAKWLLLSQDACATEWTPRPKWPPSNPADISSKIPASPPNDPMIALSTAEREHLRWAHSTRRAGALRIDLWAGGMIYKCPGHPTAIAQKSQIDEKMQELKTEIETPHILLSTGILNAHRHLHIPNKKWKKPKQNKNHKIPFQKGNQNKIKKTKRVFFIFTF